MDNITRELHSFLVRVGLNPTSLSHQMEEDAAADAREKRLQEAALDIQERFGKNAMLKGINLAEGAMTVKRNGQVGGHRA